MLVLLNLDIMFDCVEALGVGARTLFDVSAQSSCMLRKASSFFPGFLWSNSTSLKCKYAVMKISSPTWSLFFVNLRITKLVIVANSWFIIIIICVKCVI